ncbi:MAG TPA: hypothetical protein VFG00_07825 [Acidothermaceae bacterium]|nr:hypothetical protein [Acidothermaceae bacterium]
MTGHAPSDHSHSHSHDHDHAGHLSGHNHVAGQGPTVLDIGDDFGALVLYTSADLVGAEIEISPDGEPDRRRHVAVHPRQFPGGTAYAAVYYGLVAGTYDLWGADGSRTLTVSIEGNTITESAWPEDVLAPR